MKSLVLVAALLLPSVGFAATLSGSIASDASAVTLSTEGAAGWARWPGYLKKNTLISNVTSNKPLQVYSNDQRLVDGDRSGIKIGGPNAYFQFTAAATTTERVLKYYISGWSSSGKITASLPGATTYTTTFSSTSTYDRVVTLRYTAASNAVLTVRFDMTAGNGSINMQAAALQDSSTSTPSATLTGSIANDASAITLSAVGTAGWARWPGYLKSNTLISNVTANKTINVYSNDQRLVDGDRSGIKIGGPNAYFQFTAAATTTERVLKYYISGWSSSGKITASLPGATTYTTTFSSTSTYDRVVTIRYTAASNAVLTVRFDMTGGNGSINMQAVALQNSGTSNPPSSGSATLTWNAPLTNTDGTTLTDLTGFKVYWGKTKGSYTNSFRINNLLARNYTVSGLTSGTWYFTVTAINAAQAESSKSNVASKAIP